jgi:hypothetical protein
MRTLIGGTMLGSEGFIFFIGEEEETFSVCARRDPEPRFAEGNFVGGIRGEEGGEDVLRRASTVLALFA